MLTQLEQLEAVRRRLTEYHAVAAEKTLNEEYLSLKAEEQELMDWLEEHGHE